MKTQHYFILLLSVSATLFQSCIKKGCTDPNANNYVSSATEDDGTCTYDNPAGMVTTELGEVCIDLNAIDFSTAQTGCDNCNDDTTQYSADIYFDGTHFRIAVAETCTGGDLLGIASVGKVSGLGALYTIPAASAFSASQVTARGHGFIARTREGKYARFFLEDYVYDNSNIVVGAKIHWQYPMPE